MVSNVWFICLLTSSQVVWLQDSVWGLSIILSCPDDWFLTTEDLKKIITLKIIHRALAFCRFWSSNWVLSLWQLWLWSCLQYRPKDTYRQKIIRIYTYKQKKHQNIPQLDEEISSTSNTALWWDQQQIDLLMAFQMYMDVLKDLDSSRL